MNKSLTKTILDYQRTQKANSFIYFLSHNFLFKHFFYEDLVEEYVAKEGISLTVGTFEALITLAKKMIYFYIIITLLSLERSFLFAPTFLGLTLIGCVVKNVYKYNEADYSIVMLLKIDPVAYGKYLIRRYLTTEFIYCSIALILVWTQLQIPYPICFGLLLAYLGLHTCFEAIKLISTQKNNYIVAKLLWLRLVVFVSSAAFLFVILANNIAIPGFITIFISLISIIAGIVSYLYFMNFSNYEKLFNYNLFNNQADNISTDALITGVNNETDLKGAKQIHSNKTGFAYLYDAFFKRYRKNIFSIVIICTALVAVVDIIVIIVFIWGKEIVNINIFDHLGVLFWVMYLICEGIGKHIVEMCFFQIDRYLINYSFYRTIEAFRQNIRIRVLRILLYSAIPTSLISVSLAILIAFEKPMNISHVFVGFALPIILSIFYSIYFVAMYYLFQPYSFSGEMVNKVYPITNSIVYIIVYVIYTSELTFSLTILFILSMILVVISILLYIITSKKAVKSFRVR